jgi:murein L,D-transpeptidase YcbB/YkuD
MAQPLRPASFGGAGRPAPSPLATPLDRLLDRLARLDEDGLDPRLYHIPLASTAATDPAGYRIALHRATEAVLADLLLGRVRDLPGRPDLRRDAAAIRIEAWMAELGSTPEPAALLDRAALLPQGAAALKAELARQRAMLRDARVSPIPTDMTIDPGMVDATRVPPLRERLAVEDAALAAAPDGGARYDAALEAAVRRWQQANGLEVDGRVGRISLGLLNRPLSARVDQLRVALDMRRARMDEGAERRIDVNIPEYRLVVREAGRELLSMAVIVGSPARATPILRVRMTAIQFNPPWGVPERNAREDLLPRFRRDPDAMAARGFRVFTVIGGERVELDPRTIDWHSLSRDRFPYVIRQDAGDANALGRIKFIMPNGDDIFMHDTPDRHLFRRPDRAFSSGCIRLDRPNDLMALLLQDQPGWDVARAERAIAARSTSVVSLRRGLPALLRYDTVAVESGRVRIRPDVYGLDGAYARAMAQPTRQQVAQLGGVR